MKKYLRLFILTGAVISLISSLNAQSQFDNPGFEEWEEIGFGPNILEPVNWSTIKSTDDEQLNVNMPIVWGKSDDAHSGNYSLYLVTKSVFSIPVPGTITNGRIHATPIADSGYTYSDLENSNWHTQITSKPDSLVGWYKTNPVPGDYGKIKVVVHKEFVRVSEYRDTTGFIGSGALFLSPDPVDEWTRFSVPIHYYKNETPKFILLTVSSSKGTSALIGSELWIDDLELIYDPASGIGEENAANLDVYAADNKLNIFVAGEKNENYLLRVYDIEGRLQMEHTGRLNEKKSYRYNLRSGIYIVSVSYGNKVLTKKISL